MTGVAWWFAAADTLPQRENCMVRVGAALNFFEQGWLPWCRHPFDALACAPGPWLHKVRPGGEIIEVLGKGCSMQRSALAVRDATDLLHRYTKTLAQSVRVLPVVTRLWPHESLSNAAADAARTVADAAWNAARVGGPTAYNAAMAAAREMFAEMVEELFAEEPQ